MTFSFGQMDVVIILLSDFRHRLRKRSVSLVTMQAREKLPNSLTYKLP